MVKEIVAVSNSEKSVDVIRFDASELTAEKLSQELMVIGFFEEKKIIIIKNLLKGDSRGEPVKIIDIIKKTTSPYTIILTEEAVDKRKAGFKEIIKISRSRYFPTPPSFELCRRIIEKVKGLGSRISDKNALFLSNLVSFDTLRLKSEIEKLAMLKIGGEITEEDIKETVSGEVSGNIFKLVEYLANKNLKESYRALNDLIDSGANENYILTMIVWQFRQLLIVRDLLDNNKASATSAKINPYVYSKVLPIARRYQFKELRRIYSDLLNCDLEIKTGEKTPKLALALLAAKIQS